MKISNILGVIKRDFRGLTSSVVSIVILIGLILIPCLYAWFNILSNWDPYEPEQTGRVPFAVANEDDGADMLGLNVNVGEKIVDALAANDMLGWTFVDSKEEAVKGVRAGDYYAAVVIPDDFTSSALSFTDGELTNPKLDYYENEKLNAIMPKITGMAKTVLQREVNTAVIAAIGKFVSEATKAAEAAGVDPQQMFGDFAGDMDEISARLDNCLILVNAASGMSSAANELIKASDSLIGSSQDALTSGEDLLDGIEEAVPDGSDGETASAAVKKLCTAVQDDLGKLDGDLSGVRDNMEKFNEFVDSKLEKRKKIVSTMKKSTDKIASSLEALGLTNLAERFSKISDRLQKIYDKLDSMEKAGDETWADTQTLIDDILDECGAVAGQAGNIKKDVSGKLDGRIDEAISDTKNAIEKTRNSLTDAYGKLDNLSGALSRSETALGSLDGGLADTLKLLSSMRQGFDSLSELFQGLSESEELSDINALLVDKADAIAENLASPVKMRTKVLYPTDNYGSAMSAFYTSLALWAGALFMAIFIKAEPRRRKDEGLGIREMFFGRYRTYLVIGLAQAVVVALGDLLYCGIGCLHPFLFVLAVCATGLCFTTINYALRFAFDKLGLVLSVIFILLQVGGSGGTYPIHLLPPVFRTIYPFMPFHYSMDAMRECIAGMYENTYISCLIALAVIAAVFIVLGLLLYRPAHWLSHRMVEGLKKCELIVH